MARLPPLRWLVPRIVIGLLFIACVQLIAYMGVIPSAQQNTELCNCASRVEVECPTIPTGLTQEKTADNLPSKLATNSKLSQEGEAKSSVKRTLDSKAELKTHTDKLNQIAKDLKLLALELIETQRDSVTHASLFHRLGKHVSSVNALLQSVHHSAVDNQNILDKKPVNKIGAKLKNVVCPETFLGKDLSVGYPWFRKGFATVNCTKSIPLPDLITVLLHVHNTLPKPAHRLETVVHNIAKLYPGVRVVIAIGPEYPKFQNIPSKIPLKVKTFNKNHQGLIWSELMSEVVTPFVFAATDLTHFDDDIDFVRLIRVLGNSDDIVIAGGGYRDQRGHWDIGCLQTRFTNWTMSFRGGYYQSSGDCLACDYLAGPWVGKTKELKTLGFDKGLEFGAFYDLFWRLKKSIPGGIAVSCPDIMFNIHTHPTPDSSYVHLANKWAIKKWVDSDGHVRWYGCRRGNDYNVGSPACSMTKGLGNPPCDLENFADAIKFLMKECEDAGLFCELQEGTLLGAVKFNKVLPWERDADITFLTANYSAFKKLRPKLAEQGYTLSDDDESIWCCADGRQAGGKFTVGTSRFTIEMYGQHMMESELLAAKGQSPTKIQFAGQWVNVVRNPGLYARNRYGPNHFRHAEHWMDLGQGTGWAFYHPGTFTGCPYPGHSGCLDQYPADGNIQFSDYVSL